MSIPYVIILSDSEDEYDIAPNTIILSDSEEESYDLEDPEVEGPMEEDSQEEDPEEDPEVEGPMEEDSQEEDPEEDPEEEDPMEEDPEEEDPEEEDPEEETMSETPPPPSPIWGNSSNFCGAHTIRTARKSVLNHHQQTTTLPEPTIPTTDPYYQQQTNKSWTWISNALDSWRLEGGFPSINEIGESSQQTYPTTGEAPSLSIPPMIARMTAQENRISLIEDALEELPPAETHEELQQQFTAMEQQIEEVKEVTNDLLDMGEETVNDLNIVRDHLNVAQGRIEENGGRIAANTWRATDLERRVNRLEVGMNQFDAMEAMLRDLNAYIHMHDITLNNKGKK